VFKSISHRLATVPIVLIVVALLSMALMPFIPLENHDLMNTAKPWQLGPTDRIIKEKNSNQPPLLQYRIWMGAEVYGKLEVFVPGHGSRIGLTKGSLVEFAFRLETQDASSFVKRFEVLAFEGIHFGFFDAGLGFANAAPNEPVFKNLERT
jgi:hypothetical protein